MIKMRKKNVLLIVCIVISLLVFSACGGNKNTDSADIEKPGSTKTTQQATSGKDNTDAQNTNPSESEESPGAESPGEAPAPVTAPGVSEVHGTPEDNADVEPIEVPSMETGASSDSVTTVLQKYGLNNGELVTAPDGTSYQESTSDKYSCTTYLDEGQKVYDLILSGDTSNESKELFSDVASVFFDGAPQWIQENLGKEASTTENGYVISLSQTNSVVLRITGESYHNSIDSPVQ